MLQLFSRLFVAGALLALPCLGAVPALAASPVTFVSGKGTDTGTCASRASPCRSFRFALGQTSPGGEIKALDPADYGGVTITRSVSLTGVEGAGIFETHAGSNAITINAGPNDIINIGRLILDGFKTARNGVLLNSGGSLTISHCRVRNFTDYGIELSPSTAAAVVIADTVASSNSLDGIFFNVERGPFKATLDHVAVNNNDSGIVVAGFSVLAVNSTAGNNRTAGIALGSGAVLRLAHSAVTGNGTGLSVGGTTAESAGDNFISGNGTDVSGTLTKFTAASSVILIPIEGTP